MLTEKQKNDKITISLRFYYTTLERVFMEFFINFFAAVREFFLRLAIRLGFIVDPVYPED